MSNDLLNYVNMLSEILVLFTKPFYIFSESYIHSLGLLQ